MFDARWIESNTSACIVKLQPPSSIADLVLVMPSRVRMFYSAQHSPVFACSAEPCYGLVGLVVRLYCHRWVQVPLSWVNPIGQLGERQPPRCKKPTLEKKHRENPLLWVLSSPFMSSSSPSFDSPHAFSVTTLYTIDLYSRSQGIIGRSKKSPSLGACNRG
jgi:hypothetical protein